MNKKILANIIDNFNHLSEYTTLSDVLYYADSALRVTDQIFPIFILSRSTDGKISETSTRVLDIFKNFNDRFKFNNVHIICSEKDYPLYNKDYESLNIHYHRFANAEYNGMHVTPKIRNFAVRRFKELYMNNNLSNHMFMFDDDIILQRLYDHNLLKDCTSPEHVLITLAIWQYQALKKSLTVITNYVPVAISGMPVVNNNLEEYKFNSVIVNNTRLCQAVLLDVQALENQNIKYEEDYPIWEDFDLLIQIADKGLNNVGITYPIHYREIRKMMSNESAVEYTDGRLTHLSANLFRKWGSAYIPYFLPVKNMPNELNVKVGKLIKPLVKAPWSYDRRIKADLDKLESMQMSLDEFLALYGKKD